MSLLSEFLDITADWRRVFPQQRTFQRAVRQALGSLVCLGRRCPTRIIWTNGGQNRSWSAEYFLRSRCRWEPQQLFRPILKGALEYCPQRLVSVALDDTKLRKTGRSIPQAFQIFRWHPSISLRARLLGGSWEGWRAGGLEFLFVAPLPFLAFYSMVGFFRAVISQDGNKIESGHLILIEVKFLIISLMIAVVSTELIHRFTSGTQTSAVASGGMLGLIAVLSLYAGVSRLAVHNHQTGPAARVKHFETLGMRIY